MYHLREFPRMVSGNKVPGVSFRRRHRRKHSSSQSKMAAGEGQASVFVNIGSRVWKKSVINPFKHLYKVNIRKRTYACIAVSVIMPCVNSKS